MKGLNIVFKMLNLGMRIVSSKATSTQRDVTNTRADERLQMAREKHEVWKAKQK